jgi:hypothetical protein
MDYTQQSVFGSSVQDGNIGIKANDQFTSYF